MRCVPILLLAIGFFPGLGIRSDELHAQAQDSVKVLTLKFEMDAGTHRRGAEGMVPVFYFDPRDAVRTELGKAGFTILPEGETDCDLHLIVTHRERARSTATPTNPTGRKDMIDRIGFVLTNALGDTLLVESRGPFGTYENMNGVRDAFAQDLPRLIIEKVGGPSTDD